MKDEPSIQNIARRSIRNILDSIEDSDLAKDESISFDSYGRTPFEKFRWAVNTFIHNAKKSNKNTSVVSFAVALLSYIGMRLRVLAVLLGVIGAVIGQYTDDSRRFFVKSLFWGRGASFRFAFQFMFLVVAVILLIGYAYKANSPVVASRLLAYGGEGNVISTSDLLVQTGTTTTISPQERGRISFDNYVVKSGDTLSKIAQAKDVSIETILWANPFIQNSMIHPGDVLNIPPFDGVVVTAKKGDTVYSLAKKYNVNPQVIAEKNYLEYPYELSASDVIIIPGATPISTPSKTTKVIYSGVVKPKVTYTSGASSVSGTGKFLSWPVAGNAGGVSQCYRGYMGSIHNGMDFYDNDFPKLVAAAPGRVVFAGCQSGSCPKRGIGAWGGVGLAWTVVIDHGNGFSTIYGHMDDIYIASGSTVSAGQVIGRMGRTGYATGTHVHFMLVRGRWDDWNDVDPAPYFKSSVYSAHPSYCW